VVLIANKIGKGQYVDDIKHIKTIHKGETVNKDSLMRSNPSISIKNTSFEVVKLPPE
jgi:hypothetical protein